MNKFGRFQLWAALTLIVLLAVLSIVSAFYGAERASVLFNSMPMTVYWLILTGLLLTVPLTLSRLIRSPGLFLLHLGFVFVLGGAMWSSVPGHRLAKKLLGVEKVPSGYITIYEDTTENRLTSQDGRLLAELPFSLHLNDFRIEYYVDNPDSHRASLARRLVRHSLGDGGSFSEGGSIRDYLSDVEVLDGQKRVTQRTIEVNHPLHYGGYHFYQYGYDQDEGRYTILSVVSDSGLVAIYTGYLMLTCGVLWHCWLRHIATYLKKRGANGN